MFKKIRNCVLIIISLHYVYVHAADQKILLAGAGSSKITPPIGAPMAGYYYERASTGTHDDLYAHALVLRVDSTAVAFVTCDLIGINARIVSRARKLIEESTKIPAENVMISATHTHTGPTVPSGSRRENFQTPAGKILISYLENLPEMIADSVERANDKLKPALLSAAAGREDTISFNRRFYMTDGTVGWNPGKLNPKIIKPAGPIDPAVTVVYAESAEGDPIATYVNFANHLDTVGGLEYSCDYPYTLYSILSRDKGPGMVTLFAQGCSGNINHINVKTKIRQKGHEEAARIGTVLGGRVLEIYKDLQPLTVPAISASSRIVRLPLPQVTDRQLAVARKIAETYNTPKAAPFIQLVESFKIIDVHERNGDPVEAEVQVMAIGDEIAWVGLPGEIFVELGLEIKKKSPFNTTIITELANGSIGYIPDRKAYMEGNYEPVSSRCAPGSGEMLVEASLEMLNGLKADFK